MITKQEISSIGVVNKTHGVKGELSVTLDLDSSVIENEKFVICNIDGIYVPFFINSFRPKSNYTCLIKFENINTDSDAKFFVDKEIYQLKSNICKYSDNNDLENGGYADDFIDYKIFDSDYGYIGKIIDIEVSTENNLFIVEGSDNHIIYIPITDDFITDINDDQLKIIMNLPEGLINLNN